MLTKARDVPVEPPPREVVRDRISGPVTNGPPAANEPEVAPAQASTTTATATRPPRQGRTTS